MADWEDFGQGKTRNELSHGWRIHKMLTSERIKALKTEIVLEKKSSKQQGQPFDCPWYH